MRRGSPNERQRIDGWTAPGFERVRAAFEKNFADGLEVGAAFSAYHRGEMVVDLWGGIADQQTGRPWERDTIIGVFSTTKGATAISRAPARAGGKARHRRAGRRATGPSSRAEGKDDIPVRYLLSHRAGLAWVDEPLTLEQALAWDPMIHALELQKPSWEPGTQHGYHAITYGYLVGEVIRRITGRSASAPTSDEEIARTARASTSGSACPSRAGTARRDARGRLAGGLESADVDEDTRAAIAAMIGPDSVMGKALSGGGAFAGEGIWNTRAVHAAEVPAAAGISDACSIARMYAACRRRGRRHPRCSRPSRWSSRRRRRPRARTRC